MNQIGTMFMLAMGMVVFRSSTAAMMVELFRAMLMGGGRALAEDFAMHGAAAALVLISLAWSMRAPSHGVTASGAAAARAGR